MCDSLYNFRALGGPLFYHMDQQRNRNPLDISVYRSARPDNITADDLILLQTEYGIRYFIDLRSFKDEYCKETGSKLLDNSSFSCLKVLDVDTLEKQNGKKVIWLKNGKTPCNALESTESDRILHHYIITLIGPSFVVKWLNDKRLGLWKKLYAMLLLMLFLLFGSKAFAKFLRKDIDKGGLLRFYKTIIDSSGVPLRFALQLINQRGKSPFAICCHAGKDRTGILSAIILSICGFDKELIANDYALSEQGLQFSQRDLSKYSAEMMKSPKSVMLDLLDYVDKRYGSMSRYLVSIGFSKKEQEQLKANLL